MELSAKLVRSQLNFFKPFVAGCSLETTRKGQDKLGELMSALHKREVIFRDHDFEQFKGAWVMPKDERRSGVVLYLHGGGYTCGSLDYAKGFAATLASECGVRVFCGAYRLAPENPYPAALEDALTAYDYLLKKGYAPQQILLCGESAGGGLICALCLRLKQLGRELPCGLIAISPWVDLTGSGKSYEFNRDNDPSLTEELLQFYARCYTQDPTDPLCSPLLGDLTGFPPTLIFAGGDEILLDDARGLHERLKKAGSKSRLIIAPGRWHAYVLYCLQENMEQDIYEINRFMTQNPVPGPEPAVDASGQRGQDISRCQAAQLEQFFPHLRHAGGAGRPRGAGSGAGCDGAAFPVHCRTAAAGCVLVLSGGDTPHAAHTGRKELPAGPCAVPPGAAVRLPGAGV